MASTNVSNARNRLRLTSENDVRKGKTAQTQASGIVTRQALGHVNVLPSHGNNHGDTSGPAEKKAVTKSNLLSHHRSSRTEEVQTVAAPVKVKTADPYMPGQYNPFDVIQAPIRPSTVCDIDASDSHNPQLVSEYINEIYVYLRRLERQQSVRANYMEGYAITPRMRMVLVDWLVQVHQRFHLLQETLYLTVAIIDRYLQEEEVSKGKLQLVGVTAMWIASKYEEMYAPEVSDFVYITDNSYTKSIIRQMERMILKKLNFDLGRPFPLHFLRRYSKVAEVNSNCHTLAKYLLELTITDYQLVHYHPSEISAACLCLSIQLLEEDKEELESTWDESLQFYSTYSQEHLNPIIYRIALLVHKSYASKHKAVRTKYQSSKFQKISDAVELQSSLIEEYAARAVDG